MIKHVSPTPGQPCSAELRDLGHEPMTPLQALRAHCIDCCGNEKSEVTHCPVKRCPSWPFRFGNSPWRTVTDAQRAASRINAKHLRSGSRQNHGVLAGSTVKTGASTESPSDDPVSRENHGGLHGE
jgi:hypothetical protein